VAGLDRQVVRLERATTFLVDDVEGADDPHIVDEIGKVAGAPAAIEVADEGWATDGPEDEVRSPEADVALRVPGVQLELGRCGRDQRLDLTGIEPDVPGQPVDRRPGCPERVERAIAEDLDADLGEDPERGMVDRLDLVRRQHLEGSERIDEPTPWQQRETGRGAARAPMRATGGLIHAGMLRPRVVRRGAARNVDPASLSSLSDVAR